MAFELSCELSDRIAAVGTVAAEQRLPWNCRGFKPVPTVAEWLTEKIPVAVYTLTRLPGSPAPSEFCGKGKIN